MTKQRTVGILVGGCGLALAASAQAQLSEYYVLSGDQATFSVIQNGVLLRSWPVTPGTNQYQYPMVVRDTIRTMGANAGDIGGEYDHTGVDLGARYVHPAGPGRCWDGTTDGVNFFAIDSGGGVWRFDDTWENPALLFNAGGIGAVAYDTTDDTMWVSQFGTNTITNRTLAGAIIRQFSTGHTQNMALAIDPADDTLWIHDRTTQGTFEQWSKDGVMLARIAVAGMNTQNALAGDFKFGAPAVCYADCDTQSGPGVLDIFDFLCFGNRFSAGDPYACDCDTSTGPGVCDIFDFLCFGNAFNAGCP